MFTFCCGGGVFSLWSFCTTVPLFYFSLHLHLVIVNSAHTMRLAEIAQECGCVSLSKHFRNALWLLVIQMGAFAATKCFPLSFRPWKQMRLLEYAESVLENFFLEFVTCSKSSVFVNTTCAVRFKISWFLNSVLGILEIPLGTPCPSLSERALPLICLFAWRLEKMFHQWLHTNDRFSFFVVWRLIWFSLHSNINTRAVGLVFGFPHFSPSGFHVYRRVSSSWFHFTLHWVFCPNGTVCACNLCDLRLSRIVLNFCLQFFGENFTTLTNASDGVEFAVIVAKLPIC